jgi:hypothetical protein
LSARRTEPSREKFWPATAMNERHPGVMKFLDNHQPTFYKKCLGKMSERSFFQASSGKLVLLAILY